MNNHPTNCAIVHYLCPVCGKKVDNSAILLSRYPNSQTTGKQLDEIHNKVIGFAEDPCEECSGPIKDGVIFVIGIDESKSDLTNIPNGFYRSGHIFGVTEDYVNRLLSNENLQSFKEFALKKRFFHIDYRVLIQCGFPIKDKQ